VVTVVTVDLAVATMTDGAAAVVLGRIMTTAGVRGEVVVGALLAAVLTAVVVIVAEDRASRCDEGEEMMM